MKARFAWLTMVLALVAAFVLVPMSASAATKDKNFLKNVPVTGTLSDGGTFKGRLTITEFGYDTVTGLWVSGKLVGTATTAGGAVTEDITQRFTRADATLSETASSGTFQAQAVCDILFLDIGPIHLDLLGLQVDLSRIVLNIDAVSGPGNLLGNLLCALAGLLDPNTGLLNQLLGTLQQLLDILNQLNNLI